ncbi:MAG TPA: hypothetical protein PLA33_04275 [Ottowia sp.]|uniref:hypothetical protein n=1 Tax=Ottowia sp. TaxID=1898956 RepID=UPI002BD4A494|nr:hypothetical protein [Ottowia sp.]HNI84661.1 hypothetical protein [Ottowia sp.]HNJ45325.1 hypothetical protein [Ottowia sp.]HNL42136.1 hypothetical protein [Ottowia sp.]HNN33237.1 hypothetical protein [Ottowia sp.]HNO42301.1 hypothetical protein [Ottowia sp.]
MARFTTHQPTAATVLCLDDYRVPSYRRPRRPGSAGSSLVRPAPDNAWSGPARQRALQPGAGGLPLHPDPAPTAAPCSAPPVRTLRLRDPQAPDAPARLRISGRLIDVCAELERLAAAELANSPPQPRCA